MNDLDRLETVSEWGSLSPAIYEQDKILSGMEMAARAADQQAKKHTLTDYWKELDADYLRSLQGSFQCFADFLREVKKRSGLSMEIGDLYGDLTAWKYISHGLVLAFRNWMLMEGYSQGSIRVRLSAVHSYAELAMASGNMDATQYALIKSVKAYRGKAARNVDAKREVKRIGDKRATEDMPVLTDDEVRALKDQPDGRDALMMCLFLDQGLRCGELAGLKKEGLTVQRTEMKVRGKIIESYTGYITFYREKVHKTQTHLLSVDAARTAWQYLHSDGAAVQSTVYLFPGNKPQDEPLLTRSINKRVGILGRRLDIDLSPHICRHSWATRVARSKPNMKQFQIAGGWNSPAMPMWYVQESNIANEGIRPIDLCEVTVS